MLRAHVLFEVTELGKLTVTVYNLTLELFLLDLLDISILNFRMCGWKREYCNMCTYLARLPLMPLLVGYIGEDLAAELARHRRPPRVVGVHRGVEAGVGKLDLLPRR